MPQTILNFNIETTNKKLTPRAGAFTKHLHKHGTDGQSASRNINKTYLKRFLKSIKNKELILDIDASFIETHKSKKYVGDDFSHFLAIYFLENIDELFILWIYLGLTFM